MMVDDTDVDSCIDAWNILELTSCLQIVGVIQLRLS